MYLRVSSISNPRNCSERKKLKKRLRELRENEKEDKVYEHRERERARELYFNIWEEKEIIR